MKNRSEILVPKTRVEFREAIATRKANKGADQWPTPAQSPSRIEPEVWPILRPRFDLSNTQSIYTMGSCFARNIEEHLARCGLSIPVLEFSVPEDEWKGRKNGILNKFTPPAVYQEVQWTAAMMDAATERDRAALLVLPLIDVGNDRVVDLELAGYLPVSRERGLERRRELFDLTSKIFDSDVVVLTFGLIEAWWDNSRNRYVQQTPGGVTFNSVNRLEPDRFSFVWLQYDEAMYYANKTVELITSRSTRDVKFLVTVSPVPINTTFTSVDVIVANMYAKSTLRAVCGDLVRSFSSVDYFPSYESATMTPRQFAFAADQIHVSDIFIQQIVSQLATAYFPGRKMTDGINEAA